MVDRSDNMPLYKGPTLLHLVHAHNHLLSSSWKSCLNASRQHLEADPNLSIPPGKLAVYRRRKNPRNTNFNVALSRCLSTRGVRPRDRTGVYPDRPVSLAASFVRHPAPHVFFSRIALHLAVHSALLISELLLYACSGWQDV
jgi:hypothetical protein